MHYLCGANLLIFGETSKYFNLKVRFKQVLMHCNAALTHIMSRFAPILNKKASRPSQASLRY